MHKLLIEADTGRGRGRIDSGRLGLLNKKLALLSLEFGQRSRRRESRVSQSRGEALVVLLEGILSVVENKMFQSFVNVVGLRETKTTLRCVDYTVIYLAIAPEIQEIKSIKSCKCFYHNRVKS